MSDKSKGNKSGGSSIVALLRMFTLNQVITLVELDNGATIAGAKWNGFENGLATFITAGGPKEVVPVDKITAIVI